MHCWAADADPTATYTNFTSANTIQAPTDIVQALGRVLVLYPGNTTDMQTAYNLLQQYSISSYDPSGDLRLDSTCACC